ncbi:MAG: ThuA domain-containing protein [Acidimicrobiia bacterium]|nr:ThuA domain-containing protein [Acidimicrobiia bacterium]
MAKPLRVLVVTGGHPFEAEPFFAVFDADDGIDWTHVEQPEARHWFHPDRAGAFDVICCYDMPGITFTGSDPPVLFELPDAELVAGVEEMFEGGQGLVSMHHNIAGWPAWDGWAEIVGGRFHYQPARLRGRAWPDSGYVHHVTHTVEVLDPGHPISAGLGDSFEITDELYLFPIFESHVVPLFRSDFSFTDEHFFSADRAIRGARNARGGWSHPAGSPLVGWVKHAGRSPVAYLQFGDSPVTYADRNFRRALANALRWAASDDAHRWAQARRDSQR